METRILNDVALHGSLIFATNNTDFPAFPALGTILVKDQCLYAYIKVGDLTTWYPFSGRTKSYIHSQGLASSSWTVTHNLGTTDVWVQVKDNNGHVVQPLITAVDANTVTVSFTVGVIGTALVVAADTVNVAEMKTTLLTVGNNVVIDSTGVKINGSYALTSAGVSQQISDAVAVEATARAAADATLQANIDANINQPVLTTSTPTFAGTTMNGSVRSAVQALGSVSGTVTIDLAEADMFTLTASGGITFAFANTPPANSTQCVLIRCANLGNYTVAFPAGTKFVGGTLGTLTTNGVDLLGVYYDPAFAAYVVSVGKDVK